MYGLFTYFWLILYGQLEGRSTTHGSYDTYFLEWEETNSQFLRCFFFLDMFLVP